MTANTVTIRAVHAAATNLTLACTEIVGPVQMAMSLPRTRVLGEPLPWAMRRRIVELESKQ